MSCVPTICLATGPLLQVFSQTHFRKWSLSWMKIHCADFLSHRHQNTRSLTISQKEKKEKPLSRVWLFATPWTVAYQAPLSMGFSRQECWSGLPFPSSGDLPNPGIKPGSPALQADTLPSEPPGKPQIFLKYLFIPKYLLIWIFLHFFGLVLKRNNLTLILLKPPPKWFLELWLTLHFLSSLYIYINLCICVNSLWELGNILTFPTALRNSIPTL